MRTPVRCWVANHRVARRVLSVALLAAAVAQPLPAFEYPLSSEAIRDAYFLANGNQDKRTEFLRKYKHALPAPKSGPDVSLIQIQTPFTDVVDDLASGDPNDRAQEIEQKYLGKAGHFRVHVEIYFTPSYPGPGFDTAQLADLWQDFKVRLKQDAKMEPLSTHGDPIYTYGSDGGPVAIVGANVDLEYDMDKLDAGGITTIDVDTPDGQEVETSFALNSLR